MLKPKVLIVDNQQGLTQYYQDIVHDDAFEVFTASDALGALKILQSNDPDLVVADIELVNDRETLASAIRQKNIIAIWASKFATLDLDALPFIPRLINKPFKAVDLKTAIKSEFSKAKRRFDTI